MLVLCSPLRERTPGAPAFPWETLPRMNFNTSQLQRKPPPIINHAPHTESNLLSPPPLPLHPHRALLPLGIKLSRSTLGREGLKRKLRNLELLLGVWGVNLTQLGSGSRLYIRNFLHMVAFFFFLSA